MSYEANGFPRYNEDEFRGFTKHDVLEDAVESLLDNMEAAGLDYRRVLHAVEEEVKNRLESKKG